MTISLFVRLSSACIVRYVVVRNSEGFFGESSNLSIPQAAA